MRINHCQIQKDSGAVPLCTDDGREVLAYGHFEPVVPSDHLHLGIGNRFDVVFVIDSLEES